MPSLEYVSAGGYQYRQRRNGQIVRVARSVAGPIAGTRPEVGQIVKVIVKPYNELHYVTGQIARVLTRKAIHTRGHKVRLVDGTIGRVVSR